MQQPFKAVGLTLFMLIQFVEEPFQLIVGFVDRFKQRLRGIDLCSQKCQPAQQM